jgi:hypothetical protein
MRSRLGRPVVLPWAIALAFVTLIGFATSRDVFWTGDFYLEAYPAYEALMAGDVGLFFDRLPGYSGFTVTVGGPAALLTGAFGGAETMAYRLSAVPGLFALAALGVAIAGPARAAGNRAWALFLVCGAGGAIAYQTLLYGHPEDLLATACAVGAILAARAGMTWRAAVLLVLAVVAKQWAVLAILPAAMAAPRHGLRIAAAGTIGAAVLLGLQLSPAASGVHASITETGSLFHPHQLFWPFGIPATPEFVAAGHGTRMGPAWLAGLTRPLIICAGTAVAIAWWLRSGPARNRDDVLLVFALALLLRCMLDPWNLVYYHLPLVVALAAWEARRGRDLPVLSVVVTAACWISFITYDAREGYGPYVVYLAWTIPLAAVLALALLGRAPQRRPGFVSAVPAPASA